MSSELAAILVAVVGLLTVYTIPGLRPDLSSISLSTSNAWYELIGLAPQPQSSVIDDQAPPDDTPSEKEADYNTDLHPIITPINDYYLPQATFAKLSEGFGSPQDSLDNLFTPFDIGRRGSPATRSSVESLVHATPLASIPSVPTTSPSELQLFVTVFTSFAAVLVLFTVYQIFTSIVPKMFTKRENEASLLAQNLDEFQLWLRQIQADPEAAKRQQDALVLTLEAQLQSNHKVLRQLQILLEEQRQDNKGLLDRAQKLEYQHDILRGDYEDLQRSRDRCSSDLKKERERKHLQEDQSRAAREHLQQTASDLAIENRLVFDRKTELEDYVTTLLADLEEVRTERDAAKGQLTSVEQNFSQVQQANNQNIEKVNELGITLATVQTTNDILNTKVDDLEVRLDQTRSEKETLSEELELLDDFATSCKLDLEKAHSELEDARTATARNTTQSAELALGLTKDLAQARGQIETLKKSIDLKVEEAVVQRTQLECLQTSLEQKDCTIKELSIKLSDSQAETEELQNELKQNEEFSGKEDVQAEISTLKENVQKLRTEKDEAVTGLEATVTGLRQEVAKSQLTTRQKHKALEELQVQVNELQEEQSKLDDAIRYQQNERKSKEKTIEKYKEAQKTNDQILSSLRMQVKTFKDKSVDLEGQIEQKNHEFESMRAQMLRVETQLWHCSQRLAWWENLYQNTFPNQENPLFTQLTAPGSNATADSEEDCVEEPVEEPGVETAENVSAEKVTDGAIEVPVEKDNKEALETQTVPDSMVELAQSPNETRSSHESEADASIATPIENRSLPSTPKDGSDAHTAATPVEVQKEASARTEKEAYIGNKREISVEFSVIDDVQSTIPRNSTAATMESMQSTGSVVNASELNNVSGTEDVAGINRTSGEDLPERMNSSLETPESRLSDLNEDMPRQSGQYRDDNAADDDDSDNDYDSLFDGDPIPVEDLPGLVEYSGCDTLLDDEPVPVSNSPALIEDNDHDSLFDGDPIPLSDLPAPIKDENATSPAPVHNHVENGQNDIPSDQSA